MVGIWRPLFILISLSVPAPAASDDNSHFAGKTITIYVSAAVGGGFDVYARLLTRHLGHHLSGNPRIIIVRLSSRTCLGSVSETLPII
jgi:tripartite-type tricarboxylate transporter receptor subunit TctC